MGVLVESTLPGMVGVGEVALGVESLGDGLMVGELLAVVRSQGVSVVHEGFQLLEDGLREAVGRTSFDLLQQGQPRFALGERDDGLSATLPENSVHFPIAQSLPRGHNLRSLGDAGAIRELSAPVVAPVALTTLFLAA